MSSFSVYIKRRPYYCSLSHSRDSMSRGIVYSNSCLFLVLTHGHLSGRSSDSIHPVSVTALNRWSFQGSTVYDILTGFLLYHHICGLCPTLFFLPLISHRRMPRSVLCCLCMIQVCLSDKVVPPSLPFNHFSILRDLARLGVLFIHENPSWGHLEVLFIRENSSWW